MGIGSIAVITKYLFRRVAPVLSTLLAEPPAVLYHYTRLPGLLGIVSSKSLWATDIRYLNDEKEFHHALDITRSLLLELQDSGSSLLYKHHIPALLTNLDNIDASGIFVTCFTGNGDLLSQWRGYCGPDVGCSLGWAGSTLQAIARKQEFALAPCIYERDQQRQVIQELLDRAFTDEQQQTFNDTFIVAFLKLALSWIAPLFKHPSFQEEAEWRLFTRHGSKKRTLQFRPGKAAIIPYLQLPLQTTEGKLADLERIVVGPTPLPALSVQAICSCISVAGAHVNEVVPSTAPYRSV